jgi:8-oxo-dGTP diphosphatase / 2-hydroxy-dATP diphosphatase
MRPEWFSDGSEPTTDLPPIPLDKMWADDEFWMPMLLSGQTFVGRADFTKKNKMLRWWFAEQVL